MYSLYKGDEEIAYGTLEEISKKMGVKKRSLSFYGSPTYQKRSVRKNGQSKRRVLIKVD